jgi:hypothetical protein
MFCRSLMVPPRNAVPQDTATGIHVPLHNEGCARGTALRKEVHCLRGYCAHPSTRRTKQCRQTPHTLSAELAYGNLGT